MAQTWTPVTLTNDTGQKLNASYFNRVENGIDTIDGRIDTLETGALSGYAVIPQTLSDVTGATDATSAFTAAYATGKPVFVPPGTYTVTSLAPPTTSLTLGAGESSIIRYAGAGTMCTLSSLQRVRFVDLKFLVTNAAGKLITLSNTFNSSFTRCVFQGSHTTAGDGFAATSGHVGITLTSNAGDNNFYDCAWLNLGAGIVTDAIQNGVIGGKFGTCYKGIYATGNGGMSLVGHIDFVSATGATPPTDTAIHIDGATGQWWLSHVWIEGCTTGIKVGTGSTGPSQFGMVNCKVAAVTTCIDVTACRNPTLWNVQLAGDNAGSFTPDPLLVDATNAPEGVAFVDSAVTGKAITTSTLPKGWTAHTRSGSTATMKAPDELQFTYGAKLRMARSDGTMTDTFQMTGGPRLLFGIPSNNATEALQVRDTSGAVTLGIDAVTSTVNYPAVIPGATGTGPAIAARGTDTNVDLALTPKGTGQVRVVGATFLANQGSPPATPSGGGVLYVEAGALKYKGSSGTVSTLGAA